MRKPIFFIVLWMVLFSSCQQKDQTNTNLNDEKIIPKELMISIFEELVLIETHLQAKYYSYSQYGESLQISRDSLLKSKAVSLKQFTNSFDYYSKSDKELVSLYQDVLNDFNEKSAKSSIRQK